MDLVVERLVVGTINLADSPGAGSFGAGFSEGGVRAQVATQIGFGVHLFSWFIYSIDFLHCTH